MRFVVLASLALLLGGCGSDPKAGDSCSGENTGTCASTTEALFCESGKLRSIPCRGQKGCNQDNDANRLTCDLTGAQAGDACPLSSEGQALCDAKNGDKALQCRSGGFVSVACTSCRVQSGQVLCQQ
jgi:hypothetical protein